MKKKIAVVLVGLMMVLLLAACGNKEQEKEQAVENNIENVTDSENEKDIDEDLEDNKDSEKTETDDKQEEVEEKEQEIKPDESKAIVMKTSSNVNFRKEPNTSCEVIRVLQKGTEVTQYQVENGWAVVKCGDELGYVSAEYLVDPSKVQEPVQNTIPTNKVEAIPGQHRDPNSAVVVIDPGHQLHGDSKKEPNGPGSTVMKARVTSGTTGVATGVPEYVMNLEVSLKLKQNWKIEDIRFT